MLQRTAKYSRRKSAIQRITNKQHYRTLWNRNGWGNMKTKSKDNAPAKELNTERKLSVQQEGKQANNQLLKHKYWKEQEVRRKRQEANMTRTTKGEPAGQGFLFMLHLQVSVRVGTAIRPRRPDSSADCSLCSWTFARTVAAAVAKGVAKCVTQGPGKYSTSIGLQRIACPVYTNFFKSSNYILLLFLVLSYAL